MNRTLRSSAEVAHFSGNCRAAPVALQVARFQGADGPTELHVVAEPTAQADFAEQCDWLRSACAEAAELAGTANARVVFRRMFCSDIVNQISRSGAGAPGDAGPADGEGAISWVGQPPPLPAKVAMWAYLIADDGSDWGWTPIGGGRGLRRGGLTHCWTCGALDPNCTPPAGAGVGAQTAALFDAYVEQLHGCGMSLADHVVRTWFYLRDIDGDYGEFVAARRRIFSEHGLTPQTHYIASTGIAGAGRWPSARVMLDAYAIAGLRSEQVAYLRAPEHLCATDTYGVTFERGTTIAYRDRRHLLISGTASIDRSGAVLFPGDVARQLDRALDNVEALLAAGGGDARGLAHLIAYVRDAADEPLVRRGIRRRCGEMPLIVVRGAVCRPGWLVEIEGQAIVARDEPGRPRF